MLQEIQKEHICLPQTLSIEVSDNASKALLATMSQNNLEGMTVRVYIGSESPRGIEFSMMLEDKFHENDIYLETNGVKIVADCGTAKLLEGGKIDYVTDREKGPGFLIQAPNSQLHSRDACGCGGACSCQSD